MPDPRVEEDSSSGFVEQEQQHQEQFDLPSTLDYKDPGRDYGDVVEGMSGSRVEAVPRSAAYVPPPQQQHREHRHDLPSHLDYKDQGIDYRNVVAVPATKVRRSVLDLPSNLEYKDLGRDMASILPNNATPVVMGHRHHELPSNMNYKDQGRYFGSVVARSITKPEVPPGTNVPSSTGGPSETPCPPNMPSKGDPTGSPRDRKKRYIYIGGTVVVIVLAIVVGVAMAVSSAGGSSDKTEAITTAEATISPSIGPALITPTPTSSLTPTSAPTLAPTRFRLWKSATEPIVGETPNKFLGFAVDFSADASILAAGAYRHDVDGSLESSHLSSK